MGIFMHSVLFSCVGFKIESNSNLLSDSMGLRGGEVGLEKHLCDPLWAHIFFVRAHIFLVYTNYDICRMRRNGGNILQWKENNMKCMKRSTGNHSYHKSQLSPIYSPKYSRVQRNSEQ